MMWLSFPTVFLQQCTWIVDSKVAITQGVQNLSWNLQVRNRDRKGAMDLTE